ncbi:MAG: penicillin acylase family protein [Acidimicrobiales bacterium]
MFDSRHARRHRDRLPGLRSRPRHRHRPVGGPTRCADPQAVDLRPRRAEPGRAQGHDRGRRFDAGEVLRDRRQVRLHLQLGLRTARASATSPRATCPNGPQGSTGRLPTLGTGDYEWQGFIPLDAHPHAAEGPEGRLLNWNNQSAPGFMHGDSNLYGSVHRVENFDQWPEKAELADVVSIMNRAATEDTRSSVWPVIREVLEGGDAPSPLADEVVAMLDAWIADDAPLLDADEDGFYDEPGALLFDELWDPLQTAVLDPVFGPVLEAGIELRGIDLEGVVDKDLRTVLGHEVKGPFNLSYCGAGDLDACRASLWAAIDTRVGELAAERGEDPTTWLREGRRTTFSPGLIDDDFRATNRPTFQQVLELAPTN